MKITVELFTPYRILYRSRLGAYGIQNKVLMEDFKQEIRSLNLVKENSVILAIAYDNPEFIEPNQCRYEVGLVVDCDFSHERVKTLPSGKYLVFEIDHTEAAVQKCWSEMMGELQHLDCVFNPELPIIERYSEAMIRRHRCEICVGIQ